MDDYPAQVAMIAQDKKQYMCPCLSTSHTIRAAKIMKMVAAAMGKEADIAAYDADIQRMSDALNRYSWDEKSGYYAYSVYDDDKTIKAFSPPTPGRTTTRVWTVCIRCLPGLPRRNGRSACWRILRTGRNVVRRRHQCGGYDSLLLF